MTDFLPDGDGVEFFGFGNFSPEQTTAFYQRAAIWALEIDQELDQTAQQAKIDNAKEELNNMYPHRGEDVIISGEGLLPIFDDEGNYINDQWIPVQNVQGRCIKIAALEFNTATMPERIHLLHKVLIGASDKDKSPNVHESVSYYGHFSIELSLIMPLAEIEEAIGTTSSYEYIAGEDILEMLNQASDDVADNLRSRNFRQLAQVDQFNLVQQAIKQLEQKTGVSGMTVLAEPDYVYAPTLLEDRVEPVAKKLSNESVVIGVCLGVGCLEYVGNQSKAIKHNTDMVDSQAGLCLIVDPAPETCEELGLTPQQLVYIPMSGQEFNALIERI